MKSRTFIANMETLHELLKWIQEELKPMELQKSVFSKLELACEEVIVNILSYAYPDQTGVIQIVIDYIPQKKIEISFADQGPFFDPLSVEEVLPPTSLEAQKIGGLGISLIRKCVDQVIYKREKDQNILSLIKDLE